MLTERSLKSHLYLYIAGVVLFILFLGYTFWYDHKTDVDGNEAAAEAFRKEGLSEEQISRIRHDDDVWYYDGRSTCVGYSSHDNDSSERCPYFQSVCAGSKARTFGSLSDQVREVAKVIKSGKTQHPDCPLIYEGGD
jgi:hypothetical protein